MRAATPRSPTPTTMNEGLLRSAIASKLAYSPGCGGGVVAATASSPSLSLSLPYSSDPVACIVEANACARAEGSAPPRAVVWSTGPGSKVVAFRGTAGAADICDILDFRHARYAFCDDRASVHSGVYAAFREMEPGLTEALLGGDRPRLSDVPRCLTFTGHSKGGCHAQLAAAYYRRMLGRRCRIACHTFGAPATGDEAFAALYSASVDESVVLAHRGDPIVRLPPASAGYRSVAGLVEIGPKEPLLTLLSPLSWFAKHDMDAYLERVRDHLHAMR